MLKALLIVTAIGGADYSVEMPNMKECLDARTQIAEQDKSVKTLCVPKADETAKVQDFFNIFMDMITTMKEMEQDENNDWYNENSRTEDCKRPFGALECEQ
jgi:hypothetical protein